MTEYYNRFTHVHFGHLCVQNGMSRSTCIRENPYLDFSSKTAILTTAFRGVCLPPRHVRRQCLKSEHCCMELVNVGKSTELTSDRCKILTPFLFHMFQYYYPI